MNFCRKDNYSKNRVNEIIVSNNNNNKIKIFNAFINKKKHVYERNVQDPNIRKKKIQANISIENSDGTEARISLNNLRKKKYDEALFLNRK